MTCLIPILLAYTAGALSVMAWGLYLSTKRSVGALGNKTGSVKTAQSDWRRWE